jgi:hypothetical protein
MAAADIAKLVPRVLWTIGAQTAGAFSTTVADDRFILEDIQRALIETEAEIVRVLAESYHPMRDTFLAWSGDLTNESPVPVHTGQIEAVKIKPYSGGSYAVAEATSRSNIRDWRANTNLIFDAIAHDVTGSALAGYYNITNNILTFTGNVAQVKLCTYVPNYASPALQVDNGFDSALVAGCIPRLNRIGVPQDLVLTYGQLYGSVISSLRQGLMTSPELPIAQANA